MRGSSAVKQRRGLGTQEICRTLRDEILSLKLKPASPLDESSLAARFKVSRSPIREALIRLAGEGLVITLPNRSSLVAPFDLTALPKYIEALDLLQRANTRLAAQLRTNEEIVAIREAMYAFEDSVRRGDNLEMSEKNRDFHLAIAQAGHNPYLTRQYETLLNEGRRMMHVHFDFLADSPDDQILSNDHEEMLRAIIAQDVERADRLAHDHTRQFRERFLSFMAQNYAASMSLPPLAS